MRNQIPKYTPDNWYWIVGGDESQVFSSAVRGYVEVSNEDYQAWREHNHPTRILNESELWDVLGKAAPQCLPFAPERLFRDIQLKTQKRLDDFAQTRLYGGMLSLATYATSTNAKFQAEGQYGVEARDATWSKLYEILAEVEAGTRPIPSSFADIEPELPALEWP